ncbi:MAG: fibronectin type III domain-containing protein [Candidatus Peribacteraceae bacterium]|nr:fibronectin type III domain-containing protein [Candidatus Peribacteraceae bacterium]MDD5074968.1 fibronectin type III domain-containing protein [Candidatus Peribacteraceae bacterium]
MRRLTLSLCIFSALVLPVAAHAAPPASVMGISAEALSDGSIQVRWTALPDPTVTAYRIYISQKSILENEGAYDDFETTSDVVPEYTLKDFDHSLPKFYLSVMAVNAAGEESQYFVEETSVLPIPAAPSSESSASSSSSEEPPPPPPPPMESSSSSSEEAPPAPAETLHLLSAKALSPTLVTLEFSSVAITSVDPQAIVIKDPAGNVLNIKQIIPNGTALMLETDMQAAGVVYEVRVNDSIMGEGGLALDVIDRAAFFTGDTSGILPGTTPADEEPGDVVNFTLQSTQQENGLFTITAAWQPAPGAPAPASFVVRQSRDGGETFGNPETLPGTVAGARIPDVTPEDFGLSVYVTDAQNRLSRGVFQSISPSTGSIVQGLTVPTTVVTTPVAQVSPPTQLPPKKTPLSQTGAGFSLILTALIGGLLGWKKMHTKRQPILA